jgi:hypothetical protein
MSDPYETKQALLTTDEWIRYMEQRIIVLRARKQEWSLKIEKLRQDRNECEKTLLEGRLSDWNTECLRQMASGSK